MPWIAGSSPAPGRPVSTAASGVAFGEQKAGVTGGERPAYFLKEWGEMGLKIGVAKITVNGKEIPCTADIQTKKRKIKIRHTCCNACHVGHRFFITSYLHWIWLRIKGFMGVA
jgi:hypothetical protein